MYSLAIKKSSFFIILFVITLFALKQFDKTPQVVANVSEIIKAANDGASSKVDKKNIAHTVKSGDTLYTIFTQNNINPREVSKISTSLKRSKITANLHIGQVVDMYFDDAGLVESIFIYGGRKGNVVIKPNGDLYVAAIEIIETSKHVTSVQAAITSNFYRDAARAGADSSVINSFIKNFSYVVNFQRDIRHGDEFIIKFEEERADDGRLVRSGPIEYAALTTRGKTYEMYRYTAVDGAAQYVDAKGMPIKRTLLERPVAKARISSGFGMRMHPIHKKRRMHKGVDYAAPRGTPIVAAGDGVVTFVKSSKRGYGRHIKIKHNGTYSTLYGHMCRFAKGINAGTRVKQGQIIGYVGATGGATGPHLHYEVHRNGTQVNPLKVTFTKPVKLNNNEMQRFTAQKNEITKKFNL